MRSTGSPLVPVRIRQDTDAITLLKCVVHQPFEGTPGRMHFDAFLDALIVRHLDIGITTADVCEYRAFLVLEGLE